MPIYERLLEEDQKSGMLEQIEHIPLIAVSINEDTAKKIARELERERKPPSERYKDNAERNIEEWAEGRGFSKREINRMMEIKNKVEGISNSLEQIWRDFIQRSTNLVIIRQGGFKRGATISSQRLMNEFPTLLTQPNEAKIFDRYLSVDSEQSIRPKKISIVLIADLSLSMGSADHPKRKAVQEVTYAIYKSLINFYRTGALSSMDEGREFPVDIYCEIIGFGDTAVELTETTEEERRERIKKDNPQMGRDLDEELWRAVLKMGKDLGGTLDSLALAKVKEGLTPEVRERLDKGDEILVVIEITDGETQTPDEAKALIDEFNSIPNIYCRGIQIPGSVYSERTTNEEGKPLGPEEEIRERFKVLPPTGRFKDIWGDRGRRLENIEVLVDTVAEILADALRVNI
jgi:hypothetical protein